MPSRTVTLGLLTVPSFAFWVAAAIILSAVTVRLHTGLRGKAGVFADVLLAGLFAGVVGARAEHVLLHWDYFSQHLDEITRLGWGGLGWHGAVWAASGGLWVSSWVRRVDFRALVDGLTPAVPLIGLASWYGCWAFACGTGVEVDTLARYPALLVVEAPDVYGIIAPRFHTPMMGLVLSVLVLILALILIRRALMPVRRFGLVLAVYSLAMLLLGFLRGDAVPVVNGLRADQWLDAAMLLTGIVSALVLRPDSDDKNIEAT